MISTESLIKRYNKTVKITETDNYIRLRIRSPSDFKGSFRTDDIGREGFIKRITGRLKKSGKWDTQAYIFSKKDFGRKKALLEAKRAVENNMKV